MKEDEPMKREDFYASPFGAIYSGYMERPRLSRLIGRAVWGGDSKPYYESMGAIAEVPEGGLIIAAALEAPMGELGRLVEKLEKQSG
jgi:hypothetical protein